jgi:hypothetical protein
MEKLRKVGGRRRRSLRRKRSSIQVGPATYTQFESMNKSDESTYYSLFPAPVPIIPGVCECEVYYYSYSLPPQRYTHCLNCNLSLRGSIM